ncbi:coiled-coil domain-containing protein 13 [Biomphalaria glabrata]|nr:coiled-coil domain-containing protein 13 [Biomphalaria glabrata]
MDSDDLKLQFQLLQEQQQLKLLERRKRKEEANKNLKSQSKENISKSFGVNDDLGLKLSSPEQKNTNGSYISEELVNHLNDQIRQIKDENGRLYKLLNEKDFEIRQIKKKSEDFQNTILATGGAVTNETAASKIIELSKKIRELTAEKETEKTRYRQLQKKYQELQIEHQNNNVNFETASVISSAKGTQSQHSDNKDEDVVDVKALQDRLKQTESRLTDFRNQCQSLRQELKIAQKVLSQEIGENVNFQSLLNETSSWRGRAQQIIALQQKVDELKSQLDTTSTSSPNNEKLSARKREDKYKEELKRIEKERKEAQENLASKQKVIEAENESLKERLDAAKARTKVLSNEIKTLKPQIQTLLKKSRNDDEFIDALMKQQAQMKQLLDEHSKHQNQQQQQQQQQLQHMSMKSQQDSNIVEQLKTIAAQKESQVKMLEMELQHLRMAHAQQHSITNGDHQLSENISTAIIESRPSTGIRLKDATQTVLTSARTGSRDSTRTVSALGGQINAQISLEELAALRYQCQEYEIMSRAVEVEKDKMTELVKVLQERLSEETQKLTDAQNELQAQKRLTVDLEKKIGKLILEAGKKKGNTKGANSARDLSTGDDSRDESDLFTDKGELLTRFEIQRDENETLKAALKRTIKAKEEDLKIYSTTLEETKKVFLQALRQMKQTCS